MLRVDKESTYYPLQHVYWLNFAGNIPHFVIVLYRLERSSSNHPFTTLRQYTRLPYLLAPPPPVQAT